MFWSVNVMLFLCLFNVMELQQHWSLFLSFLLCCVVKAYLLKGKIQHIWWETMIYYLYLIDKIKDILKVIEYLKDRLLHHITIFFWWGGRHGYWWKFPLLKLKFHSNYSFFPTFNHFAKWVFLKQNGNQNVPLRS